MNTLYSKLALVLAGLLIAVGLAYVLLSQSLTQRYLDEVRQHFNHDLAAKLVADQNLVADGRIDEQALKATFERYMTINPSIEIYWLDKQGTILAYSADPGVVKRNAVSLEPIQSFLAGSDEFPMRGDDPRSHDQQKIFSVTPIPTTENPEAYLYVVLRGEMYDSIDRLYQESLLLRLSAWILGASLLAGLVAGLISFNVLTRRLRRLARIMDDFSRNQFARYTPYSKKNNRNKGTGDEIDQLGAHFDQLAERTQGMIHQLQDRDALRRELVSNISHDLRTPLTCLHGYLETLIMKEQQMSEGEQREYLSSAYAHSQRLRSLVGELFELAKLDARAIQPQFEPFAPAELLHDIVQKFQLLARKKNIQLSLKINEDIPFSQADIGMIEQVMENLITNAIHHTPDDGEVEVTLSRSEDETIIAVTDTGVGIAEPDLAHVFDRFYRVNQETGEQPGSEHLGLGLAIAKRIVELHNSDLKVTSRLNDGTRFAFQLPVWQP